MAAFNRRAFLAGCGVAGIGAVSVSLPLSSIDIQRLATEAPLAPGSGILVLVTLYGGNDGLNTLIPYTNNAYYDSRPELAYSAEDVIDLDGEFGLNPGMEGLGQSFKEGSLAIIRGVGYPEQDRSHFRSMDIWQSASMDNEVKTGWIGRWLDSEDGDPLRAINIGTVLPTLAVGSRVAAATLFPENLTGFGGHGKLMSGLALPDSEDFEAYGVVRESYRAAESASEKLDEVFSVDDHESSASASVSNEVLSDQLDVVSRCIRAGLSTRVYCVSLGGFDTHADEKSQQQKLLRTVDRSLTKFLKEMASDEFGKNVVVMAYSEFGRRVKANASDGTDHGTSGPVFVAGAPVRGGFYGDDPSLTDLARGDLKTTTDFRDVYAETMSITLGVDPTPILGSGRKPVGFLA